MGSLRMSLEAVVVSGAVGLALVMALLIAISSPGTPVGLLVGIAIVAYVGAVGGVLEHARARTQQARERVMVPMVEMVDAGPAPARPVAVAAMALHGVCALGFSVGDRWAIDAEGRLSRPLCRAAVEAIGPLLRASGAEGFQAQAQCQCPLKRGAITLAVHQGAALDPR